MDKRSRFRSAWRQIEIEKLEYHPSEEPWDDIYFENETERQTLVGMPLPDVPVRKGLSHC